MRLGLLCWMRSGDETSAIVLVSEFGSLTVAVGLKSPLTTHTRTYTHTHTHTHTVVTQVVESAPLSLEMSHTSPSSQGSALSPNNSCVSGSQHVPPTSSAPSIPTQGGVRVGGEGRASVGLLG